MMMPPFVFVAKLLLSINLQPHYLMIMLMMMMMIYSHHLRKHYLTSKSQFDNNASHYYTTTCYLQMFAQNKSVIISASTLGGLLSNKHDENMKLLICYWNDYLILLFNNPWIFIASALSQFIVLITFKPKGKVGSRNYSDYHTSNGKKIFTK